MRPLAATAACLALATYLAACDDGSEKKQDGEPHYVLGAGDQYVAIGDSYTAAPGTGPKATTSPAACSQTTVNYPHRIAKALDLELTDRSCNGANTSNVLEPQETLNTHQLIQEPQADGLDSGTDLVTFRLGANDDGLIGRTFGCALAYSGPNAKTTLGDSPHPCTDLDQTNAQGPAPDALADLKASVQSALEAISERAPDAEIVVIGYPQVLPKEGTCAEFPLPPGDEAWAHEIFTGLNDALRAGADAVGATYIDMTEPSEGHDTCSDDPWMAGLTVPDGGTVAFHPYTTEGQAVAALVLKALES